MRPYIFVRRCDKYSILIHVWIQTYILVPPKYHLTYSSFQVFFCVEFPCCRKATLIERCCCASLYHKNTSYQWKWVEEKSGNLKRISTSRKHGLLYLKMQDKMMLKASFGRKCTMCMLLSAHLTSQMESMATGLFLQ